MAKGKKTGRREIAGDIRMFSKMEKELQGHQKGIRSISKRIAKLAKTEFKYGLIEDLGLVLEHMEHARKELDKAREELKLI